LNSSDISNIEEVYAQLRTSYASNKATVISDRRETLRRTSSAKKSSLCVVFKAAKADVKRRTIEAVAELGRKVQKRIQMAEQHEKQIDELCAAFERLQIS